MTKSNLVNLTIYKTDFLDDIHSFALNEFIIPGHYCLSSCLIVIFMFYSYLLRKIAPRNSHGLKSLMSLNIHVLLLWRKVLERVHFP